jgi:DNA polymerase III epsilon subunit-like protein
MITHDLSGYLPKIEHYLVVDLETTDRVSLNAQLITGYFLLVDKNLKIIKEYELKARPMIWDKQAEDSVAIHGIGYDQCKSFPIHGQAMQDLYKWFVTLPTCHFVAHANRTIFGKFSTYDYAVLTSNLFYYSYQFMLYSRCPTKSIISTHSLAKYLNLSCNYDLKSLSSYLGLNAFTHHDAKADTLVCYEIFKRLIKEVDIEDFLNKENFNLGVQNETAKKARSTRPSQVKGLQF